MNLLGLRYFIAVSEYDSFTKASEHLYVSQPTLSRQIAELEEELGVSLFDRKNRSISLTRAGEECLRQAKEIITRCDAMKESIQQVNQRSRGSLRIGYLGDIEHDLIEQPIRSLSERFPELDIFFQKNQLFGLNQFLLEGVSDVIYSVKTGVDSVKELECVKVAKNTLKLLVPKNHPLAARKSVSLSELKEEKFVMFEREVTPFTVDHIISMCINHGFSPLIVYYARDVQSIGYAVGMGKGLAFLSERTGVDRDCPVCFVDIEDCDLDFDIVIAYKKENKNPYIPLLLEEVQKMNLS